MKKSGRPLSDLESFCLTLSNPSSGFKTQDLDITSARSLEVLADIYAEKQDIPKASLAWTLLAEKYDTVRENYWNHRKSQATAKILGAF